MRPPKLDAEKITHPIQLMAAWFVMLILLVALLLTAASRITSPLWIPAFLVISAIALSLVVMIAVFTMLTRFRPHLQDSKEYASWLKDERRFTNEKVERLRVRELPAKTTESVSIVQTTTSLQLSSSGSVSIMEIVNAPRADDVLRALTALGLPAAIYAPDFEEDYGRQYNLREHAGIWIGSDIPSSIAIQAIKTVIEIWPHLCYLHLSSDGGGPDYVHEQMFFGGSTSTASEYGLARWTKTEIENLPGQPTTQEWHAIVRSKYGSYKMKSLEASKA
jgi:hypothetical protein